MARRVTRSAGFVERARTLFPPGGSAEGRPSFEHFEAGPLRAVELAFSLDWEGQLEALEGTGIRFVMTHAVPVFPAMTFYAVLGTDDVVELLDVTVDEDYFEMLEGDPDD